MSKFKVGDKVRVLPNNISQHDMRDQVGKIGTIIADDGSGWRQYTLNIGSSRASWSEIELELVEQPRREFIVIRRSGAETIAELRHDREVIKSAKATCAPTDTFDRDTGAKLAFDRLMGREEPKPAPAPEPPKFYTGKVVMVDCEFPDRKHLINHLFEFKDGRQVGNKMHGMSFNHAPYTSFEQIVSIHNASTWIEVKE